MHFSTQNCRIDSLASSLNLPIDVLRLDLLHPVVSGNKWFKLSCHLQQAREENIDTIVTFGGAFSNHIVATAAAAQMEGLKSIGIIRGEEPSLLSHTLKKAMEFGMSLFFTSRTAYQQKKIPHEVIAQFGKDKLLVIPEGGYGSLGKLGAEEIIELVPIHQYTHIMLAVGTGTTLSGLVEKASTHQKIVGVPVLKNATSLRSEINALLSQEKQNAFSLIEDYHFGGYAKKTPELLSFMNHFYEITGIPTDFLYTAKTFYAVIDLFKKNYFNSGDKILLIHTGGLQGNLSLPKGTLIFE